MESYQTPGIYRKDIFLEPEAGLRTGVPAFIGLAAQQTAGVPAPLTRWPDFERLGPPPPGSYLAAAVRGFFENQGRLCYAIGLPEWTQPALKQALELLTTIDGIDLICAPDIMHPLQPAELPHPDTLDPPWGAYVTRLRLSGKPPANPVEALMMQQMILDYCEQDTGERFAILDALPGATPNEVVAQRGSLRGSNGALYYPWIRARGGSDATTGFVPPCGHIAGVYARSDQRAGVHKSPANEILEGALDLEVNLTDDQQAPLNPAGVNCLRAFPGRGIRVWGARTLSADLAWTYIGMRRLFLTVGRWIDRNMADIVLEPNDSRLWARLERELAAYLGDLLRRGALQGRTAREGFYIKCDAETNPPGVRDQGMLVTEIGLALAAPNEFVVVRVIHGARGMTIAGLARPA